MDQYDRLLIFDEFGELNGLIAAALIKQGYEVVTSRSAENVIAAVCSLDIDVALVDIKSPQPHYLQLISDIRHHSPDTNIIIMWGYNIEQLFTAVTNVEPVFLLRDTGSMRQFLSKLSAIQQGILLVCDDTIKTLDIYRQLDELEDKIHRITNPDTTELINSSIAKQLIIYDQTQSFETALNACIRYRKECGVTPAAVIISDTMPDSVLAFRIMRAAFASDCLLKPFKTSMLLQRIEAATRHNKMYKSA
jgi:DNA-binding response OmpR family regulator